VTRLLEKRTCF